MDRNSVLQSARVCSSVALRKESVDRNSAAALEAAALLVALRKESVDRNHQNAVAVVDFGGSLSARRAWIEIA